MARKTFISYKYSEAWDVRDRIIKALGPDATYYKGETIDSKDMSGYKRATIEKNLADMMYDTSVTVVVLSPNMLESSWIGWEVSYCLKRIRRKGRVSQTNGVVAVIKKVNGGYGWFKNYNGSSCTYNLDKIQNIISNNHFNSAPPIKSNGSYDWLDGSYIAFIEEDEFLDNPLRFIENAYKKSENDASGYKLTVTE